MIERFLKVDIGLREEIDLLIRESAIIDKTKTVLFTDTSFNMYKDMHCVFAYRHNGCLAGILFVFAPMKSEIEVNALVLPEYRGKKLFKSLLCAAVKESRIFGYEKGLLICSRANETGMKVMAHYGYPLHHTEYFMRCEIDGIKTVPEGFSLEEACIEDIKELACLGAKIFDTAEDTENSIIENSIKSSGKIQWKLKNNGKIIGICAAAADDKSYTIYGLGIHPDERRKGYARVLLNLIANKAYKNGIRLLTLEVDSENPQALNLYRSYGFIDMRATYYYSFDLKDE